MLNKLFNRETPEREDGFVPVARSTELAAGQLKRVTVKGQSLVISVLPGEEGAETESGPVANKVVAFSSICPHALGDLAQGWLVKDEIDCPVHYYRFNIRSGQCVYPRGGPRLRMYPVSVEGNTVLVKVEKPKWMDASVDAASDVNADEG